MMMRRAATLALLTLTATATAMAAGEKQYVVAMRTEFQPARAGALIREIETQPRARALDPLPIVNGFAAELSAEEARQLRRSLSVRYVEAVEEMTYFGKVPTSSANRNRQGQTIPFGIDLVRARETWPYVRGNQVNVVVLDSGVDYRHPDLAPNYAGGHNTLNRSDDALDALGHGTHVAGTIAAADNGLGVVGVAPSARLWGVKLGDSPNTLRAAQGITWIMERKQERGGNWIVNMSFGVRTDVSHLREAIETAQAAGILFVGATGNDSTASDPVPISYPAAYRGVIAVGAVTAQRGIAPFSNQGAEMGVVAPGVSVLSSIIVGSGSFTEVRTPSRVMLSSALSGAGQGTVTGRLVDCGFGGALGDFPAAVRGNIALIQRGNDITFNVKTRNAMAAGASGVIIFNNQDSALNWTLIHESDPDAATRAWPVTLAVSRLDGEALRQESAAVSISHELDDYDELSGTSMASPHVVGVAALAWSAAPNATAAQVRQAVIESAQDLGATGFDHVYGGGLADALSAGKRLAPAVFGSPVLPGDPVPSGRRILLRGRR